jgi:hypothetical protein
MKLSLASLPCAFRSTMASSFTMSRVMWYSLVFCAHAFGLANLGELKPVDTTKSRSAIAAAPFLIPRFWGINAHEVSAGAEAVIGDRNFVTVEGLSSPVPGSSKARRQKIKVD